MPFLPLMPLPAHVQVQDGHLTLSHNALFHVDRGLNREFMDLQKFTGLDLEKGHSHNELRLDPTLKEKVGPEGYQLAITSKGISLKAATSSGIFYGVQTLRQLGQQDDGKTVFPLVQIEDKPRLKWRGLMLDSCRHFWPVPKVKQFIEAMSEFKLNTFHWHLTEDQGWRIEIKKYPKLTEVGAWRPTMNPGDPITDKPYGGFYTQQQIKEVVKYAADRHITIVPEIEMPGHSTAALAAFPELSCTGGPFKVGDNFGVFKDVYCAGNDNTFKFLEGVLDEIMALFPSKYIHIGGDEVPKDRWKACPKCQARMKTEGLKNAEELQSYFIHRIEKYLNKHGRNLIGWDEILEGGVAPNATVMSWRGREGGIAAAKSGHDAVMTPGDFCYLDHYQANPKTEPKAIGGYTTLEKAYQHDPTLGLTPEEAPHIIGVQGNIWTEYIDNTDYLGYMVFPRELAIAEVGWTPQDLRQYDDFKQRIAVRIKDLDALGVKYRPLKDEPISL